MGKQAVDLFDDSSWETAVEAVRPAHSARASLNSTLVLVILFTASMALPWFNSGETPPWRPFSHWLDLGWSPGTQRWGFLLLALAAVLATTTGLTIRMRRPALFGLHLHGTRPYVIFLAAVFAVLSVALYALRRGPVGRALTATKDSEAACATLGMSLTVTKLSVFAFSAGMAGLAGALFGGMRTVAGATDFQMLQSLPILLLVVLGGVATCSGALLGGLTLGGIEVIISYFPKLAFLQLLGPGLAPLTLARYPDGVVPGIAARLRALLPRPTGAPGQPAASVTAAAGTRRGVAVRPVAGRGTAALAVPAVGDPDGAVVIGRSGPAPDPAYARDR